MESYEVNFTYFEENTKKHALVKVRLCVECSVKLNYKVKFDFHYFKAFFIQKMHKKVEQKGGLKNFFKKLEKMEKLEKNKIFK